MTGVFSIGISAAEAEVDEITAAELYCGFQATLEVVLGEEIWRAERFPVLELAVQLCRAMFTVPFRFVSMNMEDEPSFAAYSDEERLRLVTHDGTEFAVSEEQLRPALERFVEGVDHELRREVGWTVAEVLRRLETT